MRQYIILDSRALPDLAESGADRVHVTAVQVWSAALPQSTLKSGCREPQPCQVADCSVLRLHDLCQGSTLTKLRPNGRILVNAAPRHAFRGGRMPVQSINGFTF